MNKNRVFQSLFLFIIPFALLAYGILSAASIPTQPTAPKP